MVQVSKSMREWQEDTVHQTTCYWWEMINAFGLHTACKKDSLDDSKVLFTGLGEGWGVEEASGVRIAKNHRKQNADKTLKSC